MIFYFYGDNSYAIAKEVEHIKQGYVKKTGADSDMEVFEMSVRPLSDLLNSLAVVPMFVSSRLLVVHDLSTHKLQKDALQKLLDCVPDSTNVIFVDSQIDKRSIYFKTFSNLEKAKQFVLLQPQQLGAWVSLQAAKHNATIDKRTINVLIERVGNDQWLSLIHI